MISSNIVRSAIEGRTPGLIGGVPSWTDCRHVVLESSSRAITIARERMLGHTIVMVALLAGTAGVTTVVINHCWNLAIRTPTVRSSKVRKVANILVNAFSPTTLSQRIINRDLMEGFNEFSVNGREPLAERAQKGEESAWDTNPVLHAVGGPLTQAECLRIWKATKGKEAVKRKSFIYKVAMRCKNKFGTPKRTMANRVVVYEFAVKVMQQHGHRPTAIQRDIPTVISLVFQPTKEDLRRVHLDNTAEMNGQVNEWWRALFHFGNN